MRKTVLGEYVRTMHKLDLRQGQLTRTSMFSNTPENVVPISSDELVGALLLGLLTKAQET